MATSVEDVVEAMYGMVEEYHGKKNLKATDLTKAMKAKYEDVDKDMCKKAIRILVEPEQLGDGTVGLPRCTYSYVGGSYVVLNPERKKD